jgi:tRNA A-37 threonylcarbamoyl transferase component Bud32
MLGTTNHPTRDQLAAFDLGRLNLGEWSAVEQHVAVCDACCRQLEGVTPDPLLHLLKSVAGAQVETPFSKATASTPVPARLEVAEVPVELCNHPRYEVLGFLGAGGMGAVFKARHRLMDRIVALKVIRKEFLDQPQTIERFRQEVQAAARLAHPNIVAAFDAEQSGDVHFLVMEYVQDIGLDRLIQKRGSLPVNTARDYICQAAHGLQHAFERGMVHRDIKPANLLVDEHGDIRIADFGLARIMERSQALTPWGAVVGTPDYTAPEQARDAQQADIRADIYSLGCTLYHLLAGRPPFPDGGVLQKLLAHQNQLARPLNEVRNDVPVELARIVERMMAKDPAQRYATPAEVASALERFAVPAAVGGSLPVVEAIPLPGRDRRRPRWIAAAVGSVAVLSLVAGIIIVIKTKKGEITIESDKPELQVTVSKGGDRIEIRQGLLEEPKETKRPAEDDWMILGGRNELPAHLQGGDHVLADKDGLRTNGRTYVLTKDSDYLKKDFTFEIVFTQKADKEGTAFIGIGTGSNQSAYNEPVESVYLGIPPPNINNGAVGLSKGPGQTVYPGRIHRAGTHRVIIEKKGNVVTFTLDVGNDGPSDDDVERTIPDIKAYAPFLNGSNTHIFFGGGGTYEKMRLRERYSQKESAAPRTDKWYSLGDRNPFPPYFQANGSLLAAKDGARANSSYILSNSSEYLNKDFTLELTFHFEKEKDGIAFVGLGAVDPGGAYNEPVNTVHLRMHPPYTSNGEIGLTKLPVNSGVGLGKFRSLGPHRILIEKKGKSVTFGVDINNAGKIEDDFQKTIPDIRTFAPFLNGKNTFLFFGGGGTYERVRLIEKTDNSTKQ